MVKNKENIPAETGNEISIALDRSLSRAILNFETNSIDDYKISPRLKLALEKLSGMAQKASTGFTNIVTCLAIKAANPNTDIRYHQVQIQKDTNRPAGFNFRGVSENTVYPWLNKNTFEGAKSGWQTRTFERPKPYILTYDENIGDIKIPFLEVFDEIEVHGGLADESLSYLLHLQLLHRESKKIILSLPRTKDIQLIIKVFREHFFYKYNASKGASRLPVLALYAVYCVLIEQVQRYEGMKLKPLEEHSAADSQTGSVGDIEVINSEDQIVFEAIEVKHNIPLSETILQAAIDKIMSKTVSRYYILTTHSNCEPDASLSRMIANAKSMYDCQIIANGVIPSLKYYLRLLSDPSVVFPKYVELLASDTAVKHEHREIWNKLTVEGISNEVP